MLVEFVEEACVRILQRVLEFDILSDQLPKNVLHILLDNQEPRELCILVSLFATLIEVTLLH